MIAIVCLFSLMMPSRVIPQPLISLDVEGAPLSTVLRVLAMQSQENIVADGSLHAIKVSLRLQHIPMNQALSVLSEAYGLVIKHERGVIIVGTALALRKRIADQAEGDERVTTVHLRYARSAEAVKHLAVFLPERYFTADDAQNSIVLIGGGAAIARARAVLKALDRKNQQVRLEVQVVDVALNHGSNVGAIFGGSMATPGSSVMTFQTAAIPLNAQINAMITHGHAKMLATPRLVTTNNTEANLLIGESYPMVTTAATSTSSTQEVKYLDVGVKLRMTPTIGIDGSILAELHPEYSSFEANSVQGYPIITNRHIDATLRVKNDESIIIAGLLQDIDSTTVSRVPLLGSLPILGEVFRNRQRTHIHDEVVFIITPHIL